MAAGYRSKSFQIESNERHKSTFIEMFWHVTRSDKSFLCNHHFDLINLISIQVYVDLITLAMHLLQ